LQIDFIQSFMRERFSSSARILARIQTGPLAHSLLTRLAISFPPKFDAEPALRADQHVWFRISLQCWFVVSPTDHANAHGEILTW